METLIDQLKIKPIPKKKSEIVIKINHKDDSDELEEVNINELLEKNPDFIIYDKTKQDIEFDEDVFMKEINEMKQVKQQLPKIEKPIKDKSQKEKIQKEGEILIKPTKKSKKPTVDISKTAVKEIISYEIREDIKEKLPLSKDIVLIKKPSYYMNNREIFLNFINDLFSNYRNEIINTDSTVECDPTTKNVISKKNGKLLSSKEFSLLTHQKIILDYLNIYTPYRGLLLYHGLGSGKTCSSIAIAESYIKATSTIAFAEGLMNSKRILVMTPASLRVNYYEELKKCGNPIYTKKQYWEFIQISEEYPKELLSNILQLPIDFIEKYNGAWMVDVTKESNYQTGLSPTQKSNLDEQLNKMIQYKYQFINYNGFTKQFKIDIKKPEFNLFDNKVVIIDEAHNFISMIVNKLGKSKDESKFTSINLYRKLMKAHNCKIILLSGTPIINYPNEIAILYNILRGYIKTFKIPLISGKQKLSEEKIKKLFTKHNIIDFIELKSDVINITRTPFGFTNKFYGLNYKGVRYNTKEELPDHELMTNILDVLKKNDVNIKQSEVRIEYSKALPDNLEDFQETFFDSNTGDIKNEFLFKKRILGLTSYFKSASEDLMPKYDVLEDTYETYIDMSDYQFTKYQEVRLLERSNQAKARKAKKNKSKAEELYSDDVGSYRIFSRCFCNFVFPEPPGRPMPKETLESSIEEMKDEDEADGLTMTERTNNVDNRISEEDEENITYDVSSYKIRIKNALETLKKNSSQYLVGDNLEIFSPKFSKILDNIDSMPGLHLLYSQFRSVEGIEVFSMVLEANGYTQFKIKKNASNQWELNTSIQNLQAKKSFVLYTGTESNEEKEIIRHIYNGSWEYLGITLREQLESINANNINGEIIKVFMITASGAEGISLTNTKYIHIMEPYWHPVRTEQVIGRARRICSHISLPEEERNIKVFYYLMRFTQNQIDSKMNVDIRNNDISQLNISNKRPFTSDEALYEISNRKANTTQQILKAIKEAAIDCAIHSKSGSQETLECYSFGNNIDSESFSYKPNIKDDTKNEKQQKLNKEKTNWKAKKKNINGINYAIRLDENNKETDMLYDLDMYKQALKNPNIVIRLVGKIVTKKDGTKVIDTNV